MNEPSGSQKSQTCNTCGQPIPDEPVYVGPGDQVTWGGGVRTVVGPSIDPRCVVLEVDDYFSYVAVVGYMHTLDGRPIAGFRDPRDERIKELEEQWAAALTASKESVEQLGDARLRIAELEAQLAKRRTLCDALERELALPSTNPLAGLSDERLSKLSGLFVYEHTAELVDSPRTLIFTLLRDIRDGKLEVPR